MVVVSRVRGEPSAWDKVLHPPRRPRADGPEMVSYQPFQILPGPAMCWEGKQRAPPAVVWPNRTSRLRGVK